MTREARLESNLHGAENLRNGYDRPIGDADNGARGPKGSFVTYTLDTPQWVEAVRLVLDSDLNRETLPDWEMKLNRGMRHNIRLCWEKSHMPTTVVKDLDVMWTLEDGSQEVRSLRGNHQRLVRIPCGRNVTEVTVRLLDTWGSEECHLFAVDLWKSQWNRERGCRTSVRQ